MLIHYTNSLALESILVETWHDILINEVFRRFLNILLYLRWLLINDILNFADLQLYVLHALVHLDQARLHELIWLHQLLIVKVLLLAHRPHLIMLLPSAVNIMSLRRIPTQRLLILMMVRHRIQRRLRAGHLAKHIVFSLLTADLLVVEVPVRMLEGLLLLIVMVEAGVVLLVHML